MSVIRTSSVVTGRGIGILVPATAILFTVCADVSAQEPIAKAKYACADNKTIEATYFADKVDLVFGDGRSMSLPQAMSGSGARYANADESFVFWNKGNTAFVTEGDPNKPTYADCVAEGG